MSRNPLVIIRKQLGDVLLLEPALAKLAAGTGGRVTLLTRPAFSPMISLMENVQPAKGAMPGDFSSVVSFDPGFKSWFRTLLIRAPRKQLIVTRPKYLRWWQRLAYRDGCAVRSAERCYRARYFFDTIPGDSTMAFRPPRLNLPPDQWLPGGLPENYVLLHPTSAWKGKSWPVESWVNVLNDLHANGVGPFVVTGGRDSWEEKYVAALEQKTKAPVINLCGKTSLAAYLAVVSRARMVLCVDGSATHLAAAFNRPSVTLFGPTHPIHWHYPSPRSILIDARQYSPERKPPVGLIPVDAVANAAFSLWKETVDHG
ncbi:MAG: glycosyltransferase family 9 protein [Verrucomicrobiota bacterium]